MVDRSACLLNKRIKYCMRLINTGSPCFMYVNYIRNAYSNSRPVPHSDNTFIFLQAIGKLCLVFNCSEGLDYKVSTYTVHNT